MPQSKTPNPGGGPASSHKPLDYSRFENIDDGSDSDGEEDPMFRPQPGEPVDVFFYLGIMSSYLRSQARRWQAWRMYGTVKSRANSV